jgi:16S rRNA (cytidine1402-2'-O)-methyltransferase
LASLARVEPERRVAICRELTKRFEEVVRGTASELAERFSEPPKGEITVVIGAAASDSRDSEDPAALEAVAELVAAGAPRRAAAEVVSRLTGVSRNRLYGGSL